MDTKNNSKIIPFVDGADLLIMESVYGKDLEEMAGRYNHMSCVQDAEIAKKAKVKKLVLTHISQRYFKTPNKLLGDAKKIFKNVSLAKDLDVVEI